MGCCKWCEAIIAVIVFIVALWPSLFGAMVSKWIIVIAAVVLFVHSMMCKSCTMCNTDHKMHRSAMSDRQMSHSSRRKKRR